MIMIYPSEITKKWPHRPLSEVVDFLDSKRKPITQKDRVPGPYPYYGANGQQDSVADYIFDEPLVLLAEDGGHFGDADKTIAYQVEGKCWVNNHAHVLRPKKDVDIRYICRHLERYDVTPFITGSTRGKLTKTAANNIPIALPPLEEQRRIAAILDKADGVRRKRKEAIRLTEELLKSTFLEMFGDPVTNPKGWEIAKLGDFGKILTGNTPPRSVSENYGDEIEWIKSDNITTPEHFLTQAEEKLSAKGKKIARTVPNGSVLVTCIAGSRSSIGRAALTDREVAFNQQINAVVPNSDVDPYFLYGQLFVAQHLVQAQSTDSMKGMVNKSKFSSIEFIKPPSQKQQKFGKWFLGFHRYYMNLISGEEQSENLFNSLLQKAFRGEL